MNISGIYLHGQWKRIDVQNGILDLYIGKHWIKVWWNKLRNFHNKLDTFSGIFGQNYTYHNDNKWYNFFVAMNLLTDTYFIMSRTSQWNVLPILHIPTQNWHKSVCYESIRYSYDSLMKSKPDNHLKHKLQSYR